MNRLQVYLEELQLPIKSLFVAAVLIAVGSVLGNPFVHETLRLDLPIITTITNILLFTGGLILTCFPYIVFVKLLYSRTNEKNITIVGIISYLIFLIMVLFFTSKNIPLNAYSNIFKVEIGEESFKLAKTGVLGLVGVYYIVRSVYKKPVRPKHVNFVRIFDPEVTRFLKSAVLSALFGIVFAFVFPLILNGIYSVIHFIALDVNNPMSMFTYSGFERILRMLSLESILNQEMWFGDLGGTWNSLDNVAYFGDVNIWAAQLKDSIAILGVGSAGRFSTVYYILNIFTIPAYLIAVSTTISNKKDFRKGLVTIFFGILLSMFAGITYPIEIIMLLTTPVLYFFHLFMVGFMSAILLGLETTIGFSYLGILSAANPGNIVDLIALSRNNIINQQIVVLILFGLIMFIIYFYATKFYFSKIAIDVLNVGNKDDEIKGFVDRVGGLDNIVSVSSTPTKVNISLKDEDNINVGGLHRQGVSKIIQTRQGYVLSYGAGSYMLQKGINALLEEHKEATKEDDE